MSSSTFGCTGCPPTKYGDQSAGRPSVWKEQVSAGRVLAAMSWGIAL
jgi:hypothetical protein